MIPESIKKPNKERVVAALRGQIPDRVPHFEVAIEDKVCKAILGREAGSTLAASRGASDETFVTPPMDPKDYIEIVNFNGQDVIGFEALWAPFKYKDDKGEMHIVSDGRIKSFEDLEKIVLPDWKLDFEPRKKYFDIYNQALKGTNIGTFILTGTIFQTCYQFLVGFEDFFALAYTDTEFIEHMMDLCLDYYMKVIEIAIDSGITFLFLGDDIAFGSGVFMNPVKFKEMWLPRYKKMIKLAKDADVPVLFHSCGNVTEIFDDVIMEMGVDGINPIEPYSMNIFDIKQKYGDRITISGNIDIAGPLAFGTPDDVRKEVREHLEKLMPGGRYICSSNHSIMNDIPLENYKAMIDTIFEYGRY
jgi:uroporphyrinogen decarboxylase